MNRLEPLITAVSVLVLCHAIYTAITAIECLVWLTIDLFEYFN